MPRLTIQDVPQDICDELERKGKSVRGRVFLRAAKILDDARVLDQLIDLFERGMYDDADPVSIVEKATKICRIIEGSQIDDALESHFVKSKVEKVDLKPESEKNDGRFPEPYEQKAPVFGS